MDVYVAREDPEPGGHRRAGGRRRAAARRAGALRAVLVATPGRARRARPARRPGADPRRRRRDAVGPEVLELLAGTRATLPTRRRAGADAGARPTSAPSGVPPALRPPPVGAPLAGLALRRGRALLVAGRGRRRALAGLLLLGAGRAAASRSRGTTLLDPRRGPSRRATCRIGAPLATARPRRDPRAGRAPWPPVTARRRLRAMARPGAHRRHRARPPSPSSRSAAGCAAWTPRACCSATTRQAPAGLPLVRIRPRHQRATRCAEAATVVASLPAGLAATRRPRRGAHRRPDLAAAARRRAPCVWGSADESADKAQVLAVLLPPAGADLRRQRPRPADHCRERAGPAAHRSVVGPRRYTRSTGVPPRDERARRDASGTIRRNPRRAGVSARSRSSAA